jgi:hypothetical protein
LKYKQKSLSDMEASFYRYLNIRIVLGNFQYEMCRSVVLRLFVQQHANYNVIRCGKIVGSNLIQKYDWSDYLIDEALSFAVSGVAKCRLSSRE